MLSAEAKQRYRQMTLGEKLQLTLDMCRRHEPCLLIGSPEQVARKFELIRLENDLRNANILDAMSRAPE